MLLAGRLMIKLVGDFSAGRARHANQVAARNPAMQCNFLPRENRAQCRLSSLYIYAPTRSLSC